MNPRNYVTMILCAIFGCGPGSPGTTESATETTEVNTAAGSTPTEQGTEPTGTSTFGTSAAGSSTTANDGPTTTAEDDWTAEYGPCVEGECAYDSVCTVLEGASICGPGCYEKGPGLFRCPESEVQEQAVCVFNYYDDKYNPAPCVITCTTADDCPAPEMVCLPCPETYDTCDFISGKGPWMCAWPTM